MASASPQQPDPRESAAAEAVEEESDAEHTQVTHHRCDPHPASVTYLQDAACSLACML